MYVRRKQTYTPLIVGLLILSAFIWLMMSLGSVLTPFVASAVLAYILHPLVDRLVKLNIGRSFAAMLVMLFAILLVVVLLLIVVPVLISQMSNIMVKMPQIIHYIQGTILPWINKVAGTDLSFNAEQIAQMVEDNSAQVKVALSKLMPVVAQQSGSVVVLITNLVFMPFLLYYFLLDWKRWGDSLQKIIPHRYSQGIGEVFFQLDSVLGEFLRGQVLVMLIMGLFYGSGLALTGLDSGFAIGMIAGLLVFIPYLGAFTGLFLATLAAILQYGDWHHLFIVWAVFGVGQFAEGFFITPQLVGERIGLSPLWVIFALMAFGKLLGFVGMLLALPLAAICLVLMREGLKYYFSSDFYRLKR